MATSMVNRIGIQRRQIEKDMSESKEVVKIWDMDGGITWVAAVSREDAVKAFEEYLVSMGMEYDAEEIEDMHEIAPGDYDKYTYDYQDGAYATFSERLNEMFMLGEKFPCFFATSEY